MGVHAYVQLDGRDDVYRLVQLLDFSEMIRVAVLIVVD